MVLHKYKMTIQCILARNGRTRRELVSCQYIMYMCEREIVAIHPVNLNISVQKHSLSQSLSLSLINNFEQNLAFIMFIVGIL